jgi:hypothetical protein
MTQVVDSFMLIFKLKYFMTKNNNICKRADRILFARGPRGGGGLVPLGPVRSCDLESMPKPGSNVTIVYVIILWAFVIG